LADIPAICNKCGSLFVAPNLFGGGTVQFINCALGPCPVCGGTGNIIDGVYSAATNSAKLFFSPATKINDLIKLQQIIEKAKKEKHSTKQLSNSLKEEVPELQSLSDWLPKTRMELYAFSGIILTIITIITTSAFNYAESKDNTTEAKIEELVEKALKKQIVQPNNVTPKKKKKNKTGRNEPCPCGSGKKYKKCCLLKI